MGRSSEKFQCLVSDNRAREEMAYSGRYGKKLDFGGDLALLLLKRPRSSLQPVAHQLQSKEKHWKG